MTGIFHTGHVVTLHWREFRVIATFKLVSNAGHENLIKCTPDIDPISNRRQTLCILHLTRRRSEKENKGELVFKLLRFEKDVFFMSFHAGKSFSRVTCSVHYLHNWI